MILNLIYYARNVDFLDRTNGTPIKNAMKAYDIRRDKVYTQWCKKRFYRGY